jgi:copper chaperone CopZ
MKITVTVGGMNCGHCVKALGTELGKLPGVSALDVAVGSATFLAPALDEAAIRAAVAEAGFEPLAISSAPA